MTTTTTTGRGWRNFRYQLRQIRQDARYLGQDLVDLFLSWRPRDEERLATAVASDEASR